MTPRSLHVITTDARRGAETFAVELAAELSAGGADARVAALSASPRPGGHPVRLLGPSRRSPRTLRALRHAATDVDVVVAHGSSTLEACVVALGGSRVPVVYRTIGDPRYWARDPRRRAWVGGMMRRTQRVVALWQDAATQVRATYRVPADHIDVIPNAVPADRFAVADDARRRQARQRWDVPDGVACLAYVGALSPEKDPAAALEAALELTDVVLLVAGDGPLRPELERRATEVADGRVRFLGSVPDIAEVYAAADLLVMPSRSEGMPGALIEAGLVGTAAVATTVGAVPEMLADGRTGFLVPPGDPAALVARVRAALEDHARVGAAAAADFAERYTMTEVAPHWARTLARAAGR